MFSSTCATFAVCSSTDLLRGSAESYRHTTTINMLPDNVFLDIFELGVSEWQRLVHVCRRWRYIIFASPRRLDLTLLCTYGTSVKKNLSCWPPLPIIVDYFTWDNRAFPPDYEDDITAALEYPDRIHSIKLAVTSPLLEVVTSVMQEPFPALTTLWLTSKDRNVPVLPDVFLGGSAPRLQQIYLVGISFLALPTLLLSASDLVDLRLEDIPKNCSILPAAMVTGLAALPRLDTLWIQLKSQTPRLAQSHLSLLQRDVLPSLITFNFRGSSEYLEHLLARIDTPRLHCFEITYFNQLDFQVPQLSQFVRRTESLELLPSRNAQVRVYPNNVDVKLGCEGEGHGRSRLTLRISCKWLEWQVSHLAQILGQSLAMVSSVEHLSVDGDVLQHELELGWQGEIEATDWLELFRLFTAVKTLYGSKQLAGHISLALDSLSGEVVTEVLPALDSLWLEGQLARSVERFIVARRLSSHPVNVNFVDLGRCEFYVLWRLLLGCITSDSSTTASYASPFRCPRRRICCSYIHGRRLK